MTRRFRSSPPDPHGTDAPERGDRLARRAVWVLVIGGAAALAITLMWGTWMGISPTLGEEDRVRGWAAVLRTVPTAIVAWAVPIAAMVMAVRACRLGSTDLGRTAIWLSTAGLFVVSLSIISGTLESAVAGSHPELKWMLLPVSIALAAIGATLSIRAARRA